ncbi:hypothetical protein PPACK8108_LOCUS5289 [Phakopsora pachyrhizi]|uniref:Uncharacterized protein n=1 Tax=Phakopsora pachyrhizi TaxID=170000 RepID=A0AAV0AQK3_PHAPC|nr:hypothetical protein PPACK8108_LOCUS5289 [Phakopsora pachyrhizi]
MARGRPGVRVIGSEDSAVPCPGPYIPAPLGLEQGIRIGGLRRFWPAGLSVGIEQLASSLCGVLWVGAAVCGQGLNTWHGGESKARVSQRGRGRGRRFTNAPLLEAMAPVAGAIALGIGVIAGGASKYAGKAAMPDHLGWLKWWLTEGGGWVVGDYKGGSL